MYIFTHISISPIAMHILLGNGNGINAINPQSKITEREETIDNNELTITTQFLYSSLTY